MLTTKEERASWAAVVAWNLRPLPRALEDHCPVPVGDRNANEALLALCRGVDTLVGALGEALEHIEWLGTSAQLDAAHPATLAELQDRLLNIWQHSQVAAANARAVLG